MLSDLERRIASGDIVDRFPTDRGLTEHYTRTALYEQLCRGQGASSHTVIRRARRRPARNHVAVGP